MRKPWLNMRGGHDNGVYITRIFLTPYTRWGQLLLHIFWRGDADQDPHDHPFDFWTMPLGLGYFETVFAGPPWMTAFEFVKGWRFNFRPAEHTHRVADKPYNTFPLVTLVWRSPRRRVWGFWTEHPERYGIVHLDETQRRAMRYFVDWRTYLRLDYYKDMVD